MTLKTALIIALVSVFFAASMCSAILIDLQKYIIDTRSFNVPENAIMAKPELVNGIYYEGLYWTQGANNRTMVIIAECDKPTDSRAILYSLMKDSICNDTKYLNNSGAYSPMEKPYSGWISYCQSKTDLIPTFAYAGSVNDTIILSYFTTEGSDKAKSIIKGFKVWKKINASDSTSLNQSI
jgi:hypothetical protein